VLALLAFACVPALAQAEACDAACIGYKIGNGGIPKSGVQEPQHPKSRGGGEPKSTPAQPAEPGEEAESPGTGTENEDQGKHAGGVPGRGGDGGNQPGGSKQSAGGTTIAVGDEQAVSGGGAPTVHDLTQSGGGSSPVVPILIVVAVLAALSIGVVIYRQRRHIPVG